MIYIPLHQAGNEEIEDETSWMQAGEDKKFRYNSEIFAIIAKFSLCSVISLHSEISLYSEIPIYS